MTAKLLVCVSSIFEVTRLAIINISKIDVLMKIAPAHLDSVFRRNYVCVNRQTT